MKSGIFDYRKFVLEFDLMDRFMIVIPFFHTEFDWLQLYNSKVWRIPPFGGFGDFLWLFWLFLRESSLTDLSDAPSRVTYTLLKHLVLVRAQATFLSSDWTSTELC